MRDNRGLDSNKESILVSNNINERGGKENGKGKAEEREWDADNAENGTDSKTGGNATKESEREEQTYHDKEHIQTQNEDRRRNREKVGAMPRQGL